MDAADAGVVEPLNGREMQVLGLMAAGRSNQEIADELVVVLDTVKKHFPILDKLCAANRNQAVARAPGPGVGAVGLLRACRSGHLDVPSRRETPPRSSTFG
jgi:DNA-binding CsgD family transcriptional regulator